MWLFVASIHFFVAVCCPGTAIAFTKEGKLTSSFVVGSEGGGLYRCLLHNKGSRARVPGTSVDVKTDMRWNEDSLSVVARIAQVRW